MHLFPKDKKLRWKWTQFVQKHRVSADGRGFTPSKTSVLCSIHFTDDCFTRRLDLLGSNTTEIMSTRRLKQGSIPTIHAAGIRPEPNPLSEREKRKVRTFFEGMF